MEEGEWNGLKQEFRGWIAYQASRLCLDSSAGNPKSLGHETRQIPRVHNGQFADIRRMQHDAMGKRRGCIKDTTTIAAGKPWVNDIFLWNVKSHMDFNRQICSRVVIFHWPRIKLEADRILLSAHLPQHSMILHTSIRHEGH